ncbi:hypothetical protein [Tenacibaculum sp. C7A-26P2]|uniref:hypothetical protein n=1 Tax=Tenacibaculum sp. C7A-26P2 TaxID=3447504 RepID=UPI003F82E14D
MSTLKPNKLEIVQKQLKEVPNSLFPKQINESERHLYHVVIVKSIADNVKKKFEFKVQHKKFNQKSFEVSKAQFAKLGYTDVHIIHDPTIEDLEKAPKKDDDLSKKEKTLAQKEADLKKREAEIAKKEAELKAKEPVKTDAKKTEDAKPPKTTEKPNEADKK